MIRKLPILIGLLSCVGFNAQACLAQPKTVTAMQQEIDRLNKLVEQLRKESKSTEAPKPATAAPINLGRTSITAVSASSANGGRDLANQFYGIPNAFDNSENWVNNINYTYWLTSNEPSPWVEVTFDVPVTISSINVDNGPAFSTQLFLAAGGEQNYPETTSQLKLETPLSSVSKVRLNFRGSKENIQVHEIRVLGYMPPDTKYETRTPRVLMTQQNAVAIAQNAYRAWQARLAPANDPDVVEEGDEFIITFKHALQDYNIFRIILNKKTGAVTPQSFAEVVPLK